MLCTVVIFKVISSVFFAGLLTILLYFLALILYAFTLRPEDAEYGGYNSGSYLGEQLVTKDDLFLSFSFFSLELLCALCFWG